MNKIHAILKSKEGLTLVEMIITIIILGVVMAAITTMIIQAFNVFDESTRRMSAGQLSELALAEVSGYLRAVTAVNNDGGHGTLKPKDDPVKDEDKTYIFESYYSGNPATIEIFFNSSDNRLTLTVTENGSTDDRTILNNIEGFYINHDEATFDFEVYILVNDGNNIAEKNITVKSRNLK